MHNINKHPQKQNTEIKNKGKNWRKKQKKNQKQNWSLIQQKYEWNLEKNFSVALKGEKYYLIN